MNVHMEGFSSSQGFAKLGLPKALQNMPGIDRVNWGDYNWSFLPGSTHWRRARQVGLPQVRRV